MKGTVALVTGGTKRLGRAIVLELASAGCDVAIHHRSDPQGAQSLCLAAQGLGRRGVAVSGELTDPSTWMQIIDSTVKTLGRLDVLINNASMFLTSVPDTVDQFDLVAWDAMLRTNLTAPMGLCHHARAHLARHGRGNIVNLCDISAQRPWPNHLAYCVSKAGLAALTQGLARALAPLVRVNAVAPGIAAFPEAYGPELRCRLTAPVPLAREGTPEDIARTVRFIVESAGYITGQIISVDGGRSLV